MLSFGQCTEGMHNVMFCVFHHLDTQVCGEGEESKGHVCHAMDPMTGPLPPFPAQSSHHTLTGVLECLHITVVQEVHTHTASRRHRRTVGGGLASIGVRRSWPASAGEPHGLGEESRL